MISSKIESIFVGEEFLNLTNKNTYKFLWKKINNFEHKYNLKFGNLISELGYNCKEKRCYYFKNYNLKEYDNIEDFEKEIDEVLLRLKNI